MGTGTADTRYLIPLKSSPAVPVPIFSTHRTPRKRPNGESPIRRLLKFVGSSCSFAFPFIKIRWVLLFHSFFLHSLAPSIRSWGFSGISPSGLDPNSGGRYLSRSLLPICQGIYSKFDSGHVAERHSASWVSICGLVKIAANEMVSRRC